MSKLRSSIPACILATALISTGLLTSGCLVTSSSRTFESGKRIGPGALAQIEPGTTDQAFVLATLGPPTRRSTIAEDLELWEWQYTHRRTSTGTVFLVLASSKRDEVKMTTHITFRDGIVERVWQD